MCVLIAPAVFDQDEHGLVVIDESAARACDPELIRHAVSCCPGGALLDEASASATRRK